MDVCENAFSGFMNSFVIFFQNLCSFDYFLFECSKDFFKGLESASQLGEFSFNELLARISQVCVGFLGGFGF